MCAKYSAPHNPGTVPPTAIRIAVATELDWPLKRHYEILAGVQEYAACQPNWTVDVARYPEVAMKLGAVYHGICGRISGETMAAAAAAGIPVVNCWINSPIADRVHNVFPDPAQSGEIAAIHLISRGFKRIVHIGFARRRESAMQWEAIGKVAKLHGITCSRIMLPLNYESTSALWAETVVGLQRHAEQWQAPIGIIGWEDGLIRPVTAILMEIGWRVPGDAAIIGTGDSETICNAASPTLSSIDLGYQRIGSLAAERLHALMLGQIPSPRVILCPPKKLIVRQSTDSFAVRDPAIADALRFISENCRRTIGVIDVADAVGLTRPRLEKGFREQTGTTVNAEIIRMRVELFKRLLVESDAPIRTLSHDAGFGTLANMHTTFRRYTGTTPQEYRQEHADRTPEPYQPSTI